MAANFKSAFGVRSGFLKVFLLSASWNLFGIWLLELGIFPRPVTS